MAELRSMGNIKDEKSGLDNPSFVQESNFGGKQLNSRYPVEDGLGDLTNGDYDDDEDHDDAECCSRGVGRVQHGLSDFVSAHRAVLKTLFWLALLIAYFVYFAFAMRYEFGDEGSWRLMVCTVLGAVGVGANLLLSLRQDKSEEDSPGEQGELSARAGDCAAKLRLHIIVPALLTIALAVYIALDVGVDRPENLISLGGMVFYLGSLYIFSFNPSKVKWQPVFWGLAIQVAFALLILRTDWGRDAFQWLGDRVTEFLDYTAAGSIFLFGNFLYDNNYFAFKVLPVVVYFSTVVSMLYYLGVMQSVIKQLGKFLSFCMGTSPTESISAAGNIFLGQTEAPLLIRPFLEKMTKSEIHAVMTGGFATIAGAVMAAYIANGVPANHLLSASIMSAPAALALSKLSYPETEKSRANAEDVYKIAKGEERNLIEAASNGASMSVKLVANIAVNLLAFVALLDFVNATLVWFGDRVGYDGLTFQLICSYVFWPLSFVMGVDQDDCRVVAELIGIKVFLNEFVAYIELSKYIHNRETLQEYIANATTNSTGNLTGVYTHIDKDIYLNDTGVTLENGIISYRSVVIATYALCGFSNLSSMGVQLGGLGALAPSRKSDLSKLVFRAMMCGNVACFLTACISGLFYDGE